MCVGGTGANAKLIELERLQEELKKSLKGVLHTADHAVLFHPCCIGANEGAGCVV